MNSNELKDQTKKLVAHMEDYRKSLQLHKKGEAAIFDKNRIDDKTFGPELGYELTEYRKKFQEEWGSEGWRNTQFVKQQIEDAQRPTEEQIEDMHRQHLINRDQQQFGEAKDSVQRRQEVLDGLNNQQKARQQNGHKPKLG